MSEFYGTGDQAEAKGTVHRALDLGVTFLGTADVYGPFTNERLIGRAIASTRPRPRAPPPATATPDMSGVHQ